MKKVILSLAVIAIAFFANAQKSKSNESEGSKLKFSVATDLGIPVGNLSPFASFAYGGDLQMDYATSPTFALTLSAGYLAFSGKSGYSFSGGLVPVLAGGKYWFSPKVYGSAQAGMSFSTNSGGGSAFTYAPGVGFKVGENLDILAKYQSATKSGGETSYVGVRVGYTFGSK